VKHRAHPLAAGVTSGAAAALRGLIFASGLPLSQPADDLSVENVVSILLQAIYRERES
jgi:hypothetical protein